MFDSVHLKGLGNNLSQYAQIFFAVGILSIVGMLVFPVMPFMMDFLLCLSIAISVLILMTVLFINHPLDFNSFPSILLIVTMLRLALNISTTRLIMANGHLGIDAAGHVVKAFGNFVAQGSIVIGVVIFAIITIINFVVITKGSGRIAEVAARFNLDAMPGKQMSIDADLSAGLIKEAEAKERRKKLEDESTFYGAMDGANKFVRGDAIAGLIITFINFIGGVLIGVIQKNMTFMQAVQTYTVLTIGDGLVSQIPALLVSTSAGLLVTKSGVEGSAEKAIFMQLGKYPKALGVSSALLLLMGLAMPSIPPIPFIAVGLLCAAAAYWLYKDKLSKKPEQASQEDVKISPDQLLLDSMHVDSIKIEFGYDLLSLIRAEAGVRITDQIKALRKHIAQEMGFILPSVRITDNIELEKKKYLIKIKDVIAGAGSLKLDSIMIMDPGGAPLKIHGEDTVDPAFGLKARWVPQSAREEALFYGYTVVDPATVVITHLTELIKENMMDMLTYGEVQKLVNNLPADHKRLVSNIIPAQISMVTLQRVLQTLLGENVSIRDLQVIIEAISEISSSTANVTKLNEHVRLRLNRQICQGNTTEKGYLPLLILSTQWEQTFVESIATDGENKQLAMAPSKLHEFVIAVNKEFEKHAANGEIPVIVTSPMLRPFVRSVIERIRPSIVVMSQSEVHPKAKIRTLGQI